MAPKVDFLGSNPVCVTISRALESLTSCTQSFGSKLSGIFNDHGKKRGDPGNDVATMHPSCILADIKHDCNKRFKKRQMYLFLQLGEHEVFAVRIENP